MLAVLALDAGRAVGAERLIDALWPEDPPDNAVQALYNHVSRLRGHLGPLAGRIQRSGSGYALRLEPEELDVDEARSLAAEVGNAARTPAERVALARSALALWRGPALEEFRAVPALEVQSVALDELRLRLVDDLIAARLAAGEPDVVADAARAAAAEPLRESTAVLHVRSLAADGRTSDAMAAARAFRRRLAEETGLDPGPAFADLEQAVATGALGAPLRSGQVGASLVRRPLPSPDVPLVGRQHERAEVVRLLAGHRLVTIAGPGGVGKTSLALDVAAGPGDDADVAVVDLAAVDRAERLCQAVASSLGLRLDGEIGPADVARGIGDRPMLLVLDNCEHVAEACRSLADAITRTTAAVRVLATSRAPLHAPGEYVVRLQPLPVPRDAGDLDAFRRQPGVRAFVEHARRRAPGYEVTAADADHLVEVLHRLDGLPLGIELAARQVAVMPLSDVRDRLDRALDLATGEARAGDGRQGTLRATIASSYRLLAESDRALLRALAPFPGGADLDTLEAVAADVRVPGDPVDAVHRLVDASLLVADPAGGRFRLLFTVRAFLHDELRERGDLATAETRFLDRCLAIARDVGVRILGQEEAAMDRRLRTELDNLRAARDLARAHGRDDVRIGLTLALDEGCIWRDLREPWTWALELAADPGLDGHPDQAQVLGAAAEAARLTGELDLAQELAERAMEVAGADPAPARVSGALRALGSVAHFRGDFDRARDLWERSGQGREVESGAWLASAALAASYGGHAEQARRMLDRANELIARNRCGSHLAFAAYVEGELRAATDPAAAVSFYEDAIVTSRSAGTAFVAGVAGVALASAHTRLGDTRRAATGFADLLDTWRRSGHTTQLWTTARNAAGLLVDAGRHRTAALVLVVAGRQPGAAAVDDTIARTSGRVYVPVEDVLPPGELDLVREEAARTDPGRVIDLLRHELADLAAAPGADA
nr:BTAD domain-containing putative transcriptional regulator [Nocardioides thalensis]